MNAQIALTILAWLEVVEGRALPQPQIATATVVAIPGVATGNAGIAIAKPALTGLLPPLPPVPVPVSGQPLGGAGLLIPSFPQPAFPGVPLSIPNLPSGLPKLSILDTLPLTPPTGLPKPPSLDILPLPKLPLDKLSLTLPKPSLSLPSLDDLPLPTGLKLPKLTLPIPDIDTPKVPPPPSKTPLPDIPLNNLSAGDAEAIASFVKIGKTVFGSLLSILAGAFNSVKIPGYPPVAILPAAAAPTVNGSLPTGVPLRRRQAVGATNVVPSASTPAVGLGGLPLVGGVVSGVTGSSGPLGAVGGAVGTVANTAGSVPVGGGAAAPVLNTVGGATSGPLGAVSSALPGPYPLSNGIPNSDPVGGLSISIIATLLSLLKKDPLSLFGGLGGTSGLIKRDIPELADAFEIEKRQLAGIPSLSTGIPGIGIGGLPLSGIPGVSPDLAFLVGSIAKNIAVPGGRGLGSVTGNILSVLNGVVPNFLFKLPVVQDSVPTFGALQLLSSINPAKFGTLADLTNLANLSQAAAGISAGDLAFVKSLPGSADPSNLITTITALTDNILSLPGNVANVRAAVSVLCLKNLGLSVPGL